MNIVRKTMHTIIIGLTILTILLAAFLVSAQSETTQEKNHTNLVKTEKKAKVFGMTKTQGEEVVVDLTPEKFKKGKLSIKIMISTHSVDDLQKYNLKEITALEFGDQKLKPISVPRLGGHHNQGRLVFELAELPEQFSIKISGLNLPEDSTFDWP